MGWFWKKKTPPARPKTPKMTRISVHLMDGRTIVHYANYRSINDGNLALMERYSDTDKRVVAEYAVGTWMSFSSGKRAIQVTPLNPKR